MDEYKYFKPGEFELCSPRCGLRSMDPDFMHRLDEAREIAGIPFIINSAYRSVDYEIKQGRSGTSSHTKGLAVDISCITPPRRYLIISALLKVGFTRLGIYPSFIHVDADPCKPDSIWHCPKNQM